jgi:flagellar basal body-associated protein FliL
MNQQTKIILIVVSVCVVIGLGVVAFLYYSGKSNSSSTSSPGSSEDGYLQAEFEQTTQPIDATLLNQK